VQCSFRARERSVYDNHRFHDHDDDDDHVDDDGFRPTQSPAASPGQGATCHGTTPPRCAVGRMYDATPQGRARYYNCSLNPICATAAAIAQPPMCKYSGDTATRHCPPPT